MNTKLNKKIAIIGSLIIAILMVSFLIKNAPSKGENMVSQNNGAEDFIGKSHYNDGTISETYSDTSDATLVVERNSGRKYLALTNAGSEAVYIWLKNYTSTTTASAEVSRHGGIYLGANGGSYETFDSDFLWVGDVWVSTSSVAVPITYIEK